ncbi:MAG: di-trans,poly-cis-decaprenylcistransferase [Gammaproteobacteria bacterium]|nr:di-trans,poly-cis-decaprenylcistransferase [Gammaproteobacteria bacterium]
MHKENNDPRHIAVIMDGNTRWALKNSLPGTQGHQHGMENTKKIIIAAIERGIAAVSLFALSSENLKRPAKQRRELLKIFDKALDEGVPGFHEQGVKFTFIGDRSFFPSHLINKMNQAEKLTLNNSRININIALNYGGKWDITQACKRLATMVQEKSIQSNNIEEKHIEELLCLADQPPIDLCIRTGNEKRISNFFLWQMAYAELYFSKTYWPDFGKRNFYAAINDYQKRVRRFGHSSIQ